MKTKLLLKLAFICTVSSAHAASFNWANTVLSTNVTSNGSALPNTFTFAIGTPGVGFDFSDPTTWVDNFDAVDTDLYNETGFNEIGVSPVTATPSTIGQQPYIFGYSTAEGFGLPGSEGVLFTSENWEVFPDPSDNSNPTYSFSQVTDVVFGSVVGNPNTGGVSGSNLGSFTHGFVGEQIEANPVPIPNAFIPDGGAVEIQTFGFTSVPEPSTGLLVLLAGGGMAFRRRRSCR